MSFENKNILITGASQGLGYVLAHKLAHSKANVILIARSTQKLADLQKTISEQGRVNIYPCNIANLGEVKKTIDTILKTYKTIDILINNAGIWTDDELEQKDPERRKITLETNILGQIQITEELLPSLKKENKGIILNVISTAGVPDIPSGNNNYWKTYGASKWGFTGYTHALRESLRETKIKVIQYFPGGFESNLYENAKRPNAHNQPWMMKTDDVADIVLFALSRPDDVYMEKIVVSKMM